MTENQRKRVQGRSNFPISKDISSKDRKENIHKKGNPIINNIKKAAVWLKRTLQTKKSD
jgi:hypothetical protein